MLLENLVEARFQQRRKRFFADTLLADGTKAVAHCPNTGSMLGLQVPDAPCWLSRASNPARKLGYTLELLSIDNRLVCVNTHRANQLVKEWLANSDCLGLGPLSSLRAEPPIPTGGRHDFSGVTPQGQTLVIEVKSVTMCDAQDRASFPDAKTERGTRHLLDLQQASQHGHQALLLFAVLYEKAQSFQPASQIDPVFAQTLAEVSRQGVIVKAVNTKFLQQNDTIEISIHQSIPVIL